MRSSHDSARKTADTADARPEAPPRVRPATPVTVLTGFLGAGKTTLLNHILTGDHGLRIAVLVNDFGAINIDADLVVDIESQGDIISLANGCVCCNIRDDLLGAVRQVLDRPEQPEYIVLEASGVAEPSGIVVTFQHAALGERIRIDSILCVMDAAQIFAAPEMMALKLRQIAFADMLILNKVDLVSRGEIGRIRSWLDEHFHRIRLVEAVRGEVPLPVLLGSGRYSAIELDADGPAHAHSHSHSHSHSHAHAHAHGGHACHDPHCDHPDHRQDHAQTFDTWSWESDAPLSLERLRQAARQLPASIYRCKGVVRCLDEPARRAVLQVVGKRVDLSLDGGWGAAPPQTRIVAIGAHGGVDRALLQSTFQRCVDTSP